MKYSIRRVTWTSDHPEIKAQEPWSGPVAYEVLENIIGKLMYSHEMCERFGHVGDMAWTFRRHIVGRGSCVMELVRIEARNFVTED